MTSLWFDHALLHDGWSRGVRLTLRAARIAAVACGVEPAEGDVRQAIGLPGLANLHSHAFQHVMAGLAERAGGAGSDSFWTWRELMYRQVARLAPEDLLAIAAMAQIEMLETGFTRVGEFHYLHHRPDGGAYASRGEMAAAIAAATQESGIALTLLPVFYAHSDFGGAPPQPAQRRFVNDLDGFALLLEDSARALRGLDDAVLGVAPHSLRAVTPEELAAVAAMRPSDPVHIHVAEQLREVETCLEWSGQRPIAFLHAHAPVDGRWCLIHATHADAGDLKAMAGGGATVGLCPVTEANLGDGIFPAHEWLAVGGAFGVGSDSNVRIDAAEELRLLEYGQRLSRRARNVLATAGASTGGTLFRAAHAGGARALGAPADGLRAGAPADIVALYADHPGVAGDEIIDRWIFARGHAGVANVWRAGKWLVRDGRHIARDRVAARYAKTAAHLLAA